MAWELTGANLKGPKGDPGPIGPEGPVGPTGPQGVRGSKWFTAAGPPTTANTPGALVGDMYLDTDSGIVYDLI